MSDDTLGNSKLLLLKTNGKMFLTLLGQHLKETIDSGKVGKLAPMYEELRRWEESLKGLVNMSRAYLTSAAASHGEKITEKGTKLLVADGYELEVRPHSTKLDEKKVEALLRAKHMDPDTWMDSDVVYRLNEEKLHRAIEAGHMTKEEVESCRVKFTYVLQPPRPAKTEVITTLKIGGGDYDEQAEE